MLNYDIIISIAHLLNIYAFYSHTPVLHQSTRPPLSVTWWSDNPCFGWRKEIFTHTYCNLFAKNCPKMDNISFCDWLGRYHSAKQNWIYQLIFVKEVRRKILGSCQMQALFKYSDSCRCWLLEFNSWHCRFVHSHCLAWMGEWNNLSCSGICV